MAVSSPPKTVFIAYPRNPEAYVYLEPPPDDASPQDWQEYHAASQEQERTQRATIMEHERLVDEFAKFLQASHVTVYYDQQAIHSGCTNLMKWFEARIEESDYVILVGTPSLLEFLQGEVPVEEEPLFVGDYLYNLIHLSTKHVLPLFLNSDKNVDFLPVELQASSLFQVVRPFCIDPAQRRSDDLDKLYALLTGQDYYQPPPSAPVPIAVARPGRLRRGGGSQQPSAHHRSLYERLSMIQAHLSYQRMTMIADKSKFHTRWRLLAPQLGLTPAQIEECEGNRGDTEKCYQMLKLWHDSGLYGPPSAISVARLAKVVYEQLRNMEMLEVLGNCLIVNS